VSVEIHLLQLKDCGKRYPDRTLHSRNIFSRLAKQIKIKGVVQPQHNKATYSRSVVQLGMKKQRKFSHLQN